MSLSTHPKVLNMGIGSTPGNRSSSLSNVLGNITNMLESVIEPLGKTESKLESMERKLNSPAFSSAGSGAERKRSVPPVVRVSVIVIISTMPFCCLLLICYYISHLYSLWCIAAYM